MIYAIADLHGNLIDPPKDAETILIAGDICPDMARPGDPLGAARQSWWLDTTFRKWLENFGGEVIAIWGNHDFVGERSDLVPDLPWTLLQDSETTSSKGFKIWGTPWVPNTHSWAFCGSSEALKARADLIPEGLDVLLAHGPPHRIGDQIVRGTNVGDHELQRAVLQRRPKVTICGHIHEARGKYRYHDCFVINVAAVDERYRLYDDPWVRLAP